MKAIEARVGGGTILAVFPCAPPGGNSDKKAGAGDGRMGRQGDTTIRKETVAPMVDLRTVKIEHE